MKILRCQREIPNQYQPENLKHQLSISSRLQLDRQINEQPFLEPNANRNTLTAEKTYVKTKGT
jgi:hypothetical protein